MLGTFEGEFNDVFSFNFSEWERNDWKRKLNLWRERYRYWNGNEEGSAGYYGANYRLCGHHDWVCYCCCCCWNCSIVMLKLIAFTHIQIHLPGSSALQGVGRMGLFGRQLLLLYFPLVDWFRWFSSWRCCELTTQLDFDFNSRFFPSHSATFFVIIVGEDGLC